MLPDKNVLEVIPHKPPMALLTKILSSDSQRLTAEVRISSESLFFEPGKGVPTYIGLEYIAQAISAFNGIEIIEAGKSIQPGFLLGSRRVDIKTPFLPENTIVLVDVYMSFNEGGMVVFDGALSLNDETLLTAKVNAFQPEDSVQFIQDAKTITNNL